MLPPAAIARFYDMFIAPNRIAFEVEHDLIVPGDIGVGNTTVAAVVLVGSGAGTAVVPVTQARVSAEIPVVAPR